jgi:hypothetical protein
VFLSARPTSVDLVENDLVQGRAFNGNLTKMPTNGTLTKSTIKNDLIQGRGLRACMPAWATWVGV